MTSEIALQNLIGLTLDDARAALQQNETLRALQLEVIETAPPSRPQFGARTQSARAAKKAEASTRAPHRETHFGDFRVLRARCGENALELLVARETLRDAEEAAAF